MLIAFDSAVGGYSIMLAIHHKDTVIDKRHKSIHFMFYEATCAHFPHKLSCGKRFRGVLRNRTSATDFIFASQSSFTKKVVTKAILITNRSHWDALLKSVRCEIISFTRNEQIDAYVLRWVVDIKSFYAMLPHLLINKTTDIVRNWRSFFCFRDANLSNELNDTRAFWQLFIHQQNSLLRWIKSFYK